MKKYKVTQEFMDALYDWRDEYTKSVFGVNAVSLTNMPEIVRSWRFEYNSSIETNKRLGVIINWINGEDVFETQKTYKYYIARTSSPVMYFSMKKWYHSEFPHYNAFLSEKKVFDTREEAEKWLIPGYEVVKYDGNEL